MRPRVSFPRNGRNFPASPVLEVWNMQIIAGIRDLIFDLGGVIINLDTYRTVQAFARLADCPVAELEPLLTLPFFIEYEKGRLTDEAFRDHVRHLLKTNATDKEVDAAWNAMLLDVPPARIGLLRALASRYRLFLLSNTNAIHLRCFHDHVLPAIGLNSLEPLFSKSFFSHQVGMRKPDEEIFEFVLRDTRATPGATLFLDDNEDNLRGAQRCGIRTFHVHQPDAIFTAFNVSTPGEAQPL